MKNLILKYKEIITYVIFGGLTTLVSLITFKAANTVLGESKYLVSNVISWILAVIFAYVTNKLWVFSSRSWKPEIVLREVAEFFGARLFSLGCEELGLWLLVSVCGLSAFSREIFGFTVTGSDVSKLIMQVVVVILNYVFSKFVIFKSKKRVEESIDNN